MPRKCSKRRLSIAAAVVIAAACTIVPASAQEPATGDAAGSEDRMAEARRQFQAGVNLLDDPEGAKYEEAYRAFKKAYELSQSPKVLGNIGFCAMHLERDGEAIDAYTAYLRDVQDVQERERAQIQRDLSTLTSTMGRIRLRVKQPRPSSTVLDTRTQTRGPAVENVYAFDGTELVLRVRPGRHTLKLKSGSAESAPFEATVESGAELSHELTFAAPQTATPPQVVRRSPSIAGPIVLGTVGLLGIGTGVVTGLLARGKASDIEDRCPNDLCPRDYDLASDRTSAKTFGTVADVSFIAGGALLGGALLWYVLLPKGDSAKTTARAVSRADWLPGAMCTRDGCGFQLRRGF